MDYFLNPIKNHYFDFEGRASRKEYWMFVLYYAIVSVLLVIVGKLLGVEWLDSIFALAILLPALSMAVRRMHDIGKSAWWVLLSLIPILGSLILLYFTVQKGDIGTNAYGDDPLGNTPTGPSAETPTPTSQTPATDTGTQPEVPNSESQM